MANTGRTILRNITLVSVSLLLSLVLAEIVLRAVLPPPVNWVQPQELYRFDAETGHWLVPGQTAFTHDKPVSINSRGIRDREYASEASPGTCRILALGDSQTFGNGLDEKDTWPRQLESILNQPGGPGRYEVINSGLPASDTWQHEIMLERMTGYYHPDAVVLALYVNDVTRRFTPKPEWFSNKKHVNNRIVYLLKSSVLLLSLRQAYNAVYQMVSPSPAFLGQQALLRGEDTGNLRERWQQVDESVAAMKFNADRHGMDFLIAALPRRDQVDGRMPWEGYFRHLQRIAERHDITLLDMQKPLQQAYRKYGKALFIPWDGHNSAIANGVIAGEIAGHLPGCR